MVKKNNTFNMIEKDFLKNNIKIDRVGFYDDPNFIRVEQKNSTYLNEYAKYVQLKMYDVEYLKSVRVKLPIIAELLNKELIRDGRLGACIDISSTLSRILEEEGIWNHMMFGSLSIEFPKKSGIPQKHFWSIDIKDNVRAAHAWIFVPPYHVVDLTIKQQEYKQGEEQYLPSMILSESYRDYTPTYKDLISPEAMRILAYRGIKSVDVLSRTIPQFKVFNNDFKSISTSYNETKLHYIPTSVSAPDLSFIEARNLKLSGKYGYEIYRDIIKPALNLKDT